jgi:UDP:flavonoid glycosyltransferase YjiC (YdhE family)
MLIVPHAYDQPDNAMRVVKLGMARTLPTKSYVASRVATQPRPLAEPRHAQRARR